MSLKGCDCSSFAGTHGYIVPAHRQGIWRRGIHCLLGLTHVNDRENVLKVLGEEMASDSVQEDMIKVLKIADLCTTKLQYISRPPSTVAKFGENIFVVLDDAGL
ncbi:hypothetical protein NC653_031362 [Populus alba x Populus x berolinensis]|uniref:Uncharacterized protein n=1 Tax=Populus alba x Populus x berolinensis TaxID=444605 RepID=A0AAD6LYB1_9ROSI|nr:hypothetical protein NC653_031362 [Populus alba x Populus x berolinensis]